MELKKGILSLAILLPLLSASAQAFEPQPSNLLETDFVTQASEDPNSLELEKLERLAERNFGSQNYNETERQIRAALGIEPRDSSLWFNLGVTMLAANKAVQSMQYFEKSLAISPGRAEAYFFLGCIHERLGHSSEASKYYQQFVLHFPTLTTQKSESAGIIFCARYLPYLKTRLPALQFAGLQKRSYYFERAQVFIPCAHPRPDCWLYPLPEIINRRPGPWIKKIQFTEPQLPSNDV